jgi:hypothetical protein
VPRARASTKQTMQWARTVHRAKQEHRAERNDDELVHLEQKFPCECERRRKGRRRLSKRVFFFFHSSQARTATRTRETRSVHTRKKEADESETRASNEVTTARVCILGRVCRRVEHRDRWTSSSKTPATTELLAHIATLFSVVSTHVRACNSARHSGRTRNDEQ